MLAIDENHSPLTHEQAAKAFNVKSVTICRLRQRLAEEGLDVAINSKHSRHGEKRKMDGEAEAHLVALTCSTPPEGSARWTLNLIRDKMIELEYVEEISRSTIHESLKKTNLSLGRRKNGVSPMRKAPTL